MKVLEAEAMEIIRAAIHPAPPPLPLRHVDTGWQYRAMYVQRNRIFPLRAPGHRRDPKAQRPERRGRPVDAHVRGSMEKKQQEAYR